MKNNIFAIFGRFQPMTAGHEKMLKTANAFANELQEYSIIDVGLSGKVDTNKNPLSYSSREELIKICTAKNQIDVICSQHHNVIDFLKHIQIANINFTNNLYLFCGDDQYKDYHRITNDYNGKDFEFNNTMVINVGLRTGNTLIENISATKAREAVFNNDIVAYSQLMPKSYNTDDILYSFDLLKQSLIK